MPVSLPDAGPAAAADAERFAFTGAYRFEDGTAAADQAFRSGAPAASQPSDGALEALHLPPGLIPIRIADEAPKNVPATPLTARDLVKGPAATEGESAIVTSALPPDAPLTEPPPGLSAPGDAARQTPVAGDKPPFTAEQRSALGAAALETAPDQPATNVPLPTIGPERPLAAERDREQSEPTRSRRLPKRPAGAQSARLSPALREATVPARSRQPTPTAVRPQPPPSSLLLPTPPWAERAFGIGR